MFSGIGGFELGIKKAWQSIQSSNEMGCMGHIRGESNTNHCDGSGGRTYTNDKGWQCIGFSEIDKHAIATFESHFPDIKNYGDATKINPSELPDFDMLCGGFPCQSFSIAGKRKGFQDTRGTLFHEILRIAKAKRPRLLFLENVKGLLSADDGRCFATIISSLDELGYDVEWQVLNSKYFGVPQNRERVFIIGHLRGESSRQVFPIGESSTKNMETQTVGTIKAGYYKVGYDNPVIRTHSLQPRSKDRPSYKKAIEAGLSAPGGSGHLSKDDGTSYCLDSGNTQAIEINATYRHAMDGFKGYNNLSPAIKSSEGSGNQILINKIRRLTPTECERLQGFPDNWTIGSDTQRYKQCGNAVTVNVIEAIAEKITGVII